MLGSKAPDLHIFGLEFENIIVIFKNQHHRVCLTVKLREKMKMPKLGTKNTLFWYF